jgi:hypothetical protein
MDHIPEDLIPRIDELPGDLSEVARVIDKHAPGQGVTITMALAERFRSTYVLFHNTDALKRAARNRRIIEMYDAGIKVPEIARIVGLGARWVWEILGKSPEDEKQLKLF